MKKNQIFLMINLIVLGAVSYASGTVVKKTAVRNDMDILQESLNVKDEMGYTPLVKAVLNKNIEEVSRLLNNGADPNVRVGGGETAFTLCFPAHKGLFHSESEISDRLCIAEMLLNAGADLEVEDNYGHNALYRILGDSLLFENSDRRYLRFLLKHGAGLPYDRMTKMGPRRRLNLEVEAMNKEPGAKQLRLPEDIWEELQVEMKRLQEEEFAKQEERIKEIQEKKEREKQEEEEREEQEKKLRSKQSIRKKAARKKEKMD